jgi:hypothetical protein
MDNNLKKPFSKRSINIDNIFNPKVTPLEKYILKGDENSLKEVPKKYINKMASEYNNFSSELIKSRTLYNRLNKEFGFHNINDDYRSMDVEVVEEDENENDIFQNEISKEYLFTLYNEGTTTDSENKNTDIFLSENQKKLFKLEDNNKYIYSLKECHPFSMFYSTKYRDLIKNDGILSLPAPRLINSDNWMKEPDLSYESIFRGMSIEDKKGLISVDKNIIKKFDGLLSNIIGQLLRVPFGHHISIPIKSFEPLTVHEKYINLFAFANKFLIPASSPNFDKYERFKSCISFVFAGLYIPICHLKPFNPFLGETYQGELPNGAKLYIEQVTHSPLVARYYIIYKKIYEISGYWNLSVKTMKLGTQIAVCQKGPIYIKFPQINECIIGHYPEIRMINLISDDRANYYFGNMVFLDIKNNYKAVIKFYQNQKCFHEIVGSVLKYKYDKNFVYDYDKEWDYGNKFKISTKISNQIHNKFEKIDAISGSWVSRLVIGDEVTWDIHSQTPEFIRPVKKCIPSDGRFREDLIWLYRSFYCSKNEEEKKIYMDIAQKWKIMMEEFNRWERKRRAEIKNKKNK